MKTVNRKLLESWNMLDSGEDIHPLVVDGERLLKWTGIGWVDTGPATEADKQQYPTVVEE